MAEDPAGRRPVSPRRIRTRCAGLSPARAALVLLLLALAVLASLSQVPAALDLIEAHEAKIARTPTDDIALYQGIVSQVRTGAGYYQAATATQRALGYPVRPFVTVRPPTLTWLIATLSPTGARVLLLLLVGVTIAAWAIRLSRTIPPTTRGITLGVCLIMLGTLPTATPPAIWHTEIWAGLLIALSLALRGPGTWVPAVAAGLVAALFRELALPYLLAMALLATIAGERREAGGWLITSAIFGVALLAHALAVGSFTHPGDLASSGWVDIAGWALVLSAACQGTILLALPPIVTAAILPLGLFGLAVWSGPLGLRTFVTLSGYTLLIALIARPDNVYWVWVIAPIILVGFLPLPTALVDLWRALRPRG